MSWSLLQFPVSFLLGEKVNKRREMFTPGKRQIWECITLETLCLQRQTVGPSLVG